jgi:hypothetical protein
MKFSFPRAATDGPGVRFTPKRGAEVRSIFTRGCAARCCSGRSLKCQPARPLNQMTTSGHVSQRRSRANALVITRDHLRGRTAGGSGFWTAANSSGSLPNCCSTRSPAGTLKSGAPPIGGHAKPPVLSSAKRSSEEGDGRKRRREDSPRGSGDRSQSDSAALPDILSPGSANDFSPAAIVTVSRFSSGGIGQLQPSPYAQNGL